MAIQKKAARKKFRIGLILLRQDDSTASTRLPNLAASKKRFAISAACGCIRTTIPDERDDYLHAECRSVLGFLDDLELQFRPNDRMVAVPFAARTRYYDFGVYRRLGKFRRELRETGCAEASPGSEHYLPDFASPPGARIV